MALFTSPVPTSMLLITTNLLDTSGKRISFGKFFFYVSDNEWSLVETKTRDTLVFSFLFYLGDQQRVSGGGQGRGGVGSKAKNNNYNFSERVRRTSLIEHEKKKKTFPLD